jgi:hypothetical protein
MEKKRMREKKKHTEKRSAALEKEEKEKEAAGDVLKTRSQYPVPDLMPCVISSALELSIYY